MPSLNQGPWVEYWHVINKNVHVKVFLRLNQEPWVESAIFWIEGVATPGVSIGGLLGQDDNGDENWLIAFHLIYSLFWGYTNIMVCSLKMTLVSWDLQNSRFRQFNIFPGNVICILVLSKNKNSLDLKPSFTNLLIGLVRFFFSFSWWDFQELNLLAI